MSDYEIGDDVGETYEVRDDGDPDAPICSCCNGSGEGMWDGSLCRACRGSGHDYGDDDCDGRDDDRDDYEDVDQAARRYERWIG